MYHQYVSTTPPKMSILVRDRWMRGAEAHGWGCQLDDTQSWCPCLMVKQGNLIASLGILTYFSISLQKEGI